jgi:hypothetical protein
MAPDTFVIAKLLYKAIMAIPGRSSKKVKICPWGAAINAYQEPWLGILSGRVTLLWERGARATWQGVWLLASSEDEIRGVRLLSWTSVWKTTFLTVTTLIGSWLLIYWLSLIPVLQRPTAETNSSHN